MQLLISFSVCLLLAVTALAQRPHPCTSPPLMTGSISLTYPKGELFVFERFTYDALRERIRVRVYGVTHNKPFHEDILMLFHEGLVYQISHRNKTCTKKPFKVPFQPIVVPPNATHQAQVIIGSSSAPGQGLIVNNWIGDIPEQKATYFLTFTEFGCLPVTSLYHTDKTGWILTSFFNILIGTGDPQDFIPPSFCDTTNPVAEGEEAVTDFFEALRKNDDQQEQPAA